MGKWTHQKSRTNTSERDLFHVRLVMATVDAHVSTISGAQAHSLSLRMTAWTHQVVQQYPHSSRTLPQIFRCCSNCFPHLSGSHWTVESNARQKGVAPLSWISQKKNLTWIHPYELAPPPHHFGTSKGKMAWTLNPQSAWEFCRGF